MKLIDIDDDRNCYIGSDGEYEKWNIDLDVLSEGLRWIPSTEAEPEINHEYLVTVKNKRGERFVARDDYFIYGWDDFGDSEWTVVAYMQIPGPYKW